MRLLATSLIMVLALATGSSASESKRIVSASGVSTEILFALALGDQVVAVDTSSSYPETAQQLPKVGYARQLSAEGILSMNPDHVIVSAEAGPPEVLKALQAAGVQLTELPSGHTVEAAKERINLLANSFGAASAGKILATTMTDDLKQVVAIHQDPPTVLFIYSRAGGMMNVAGQGTAAAAIIELAGGVNAIEGFTGYKPLTPEAAVNARPDVILVTTGGLEAAGGSDALLSHVGLKLTPAGRAGRVVVIDDLKLLGFGPRLGEAARELNRELSGLRLAQE